MYVINIVKAMKKPASPKKLRRKNKKFSFLVAITERYIPTPPLKKKKKPKKLPLPNNLSLRLEFIQLIR